MRNRRPMMWVVPLALLVCLVGHAEADPIGGAVMTGLPGLVLIALAAIALLEGIIWLVEGIAYAAFGGLTWGRALATSLLANVASFVAGTFAIWHATSFWSQARAGMLVCLAVEIPIVMGMNWSVVTAAPVPTVPDGQRALPQPAGNWRGAAGRLLATAVAANLATCLAVAFLAAT